MLLMILVACRMIVSVLCQVGVYRELMMSAWISTRGGLYKKWSESSCLGPFDLDGLGVLESDGAIANGRPSRIDVPLS